MNINPGMVTLLASKNLGDLSKNTPTVKELPMAILKAVENVGAHKITGGKQGVSICCCPFISPFIVACFSFYIFFLFVQPLWTQVADMLFKQGAACEQ